MARVRIERRGWVVAREKTLRAALRDTGTCLIFYAHARNETGQVNALSKKIALSAEVFHAAPKPRCGFGHRS
jgi:cysteine sulfinate desulfinase/cysteine desulfurase-like protein